MEGRHMSMIINPKKGMAKPKSGEPKAKGDAQAKKQSGSIQGGNATDATPQVEPVSQAAVNQNVAVDSSSDGLSV